MKYKKGFKYQLWEDEYLIGTDIKPDNQIDTRYISLSPGGTLLIRAGYAWNGPSGWTWDTKNTMTPSLIHDALYQLMRMELLPYWYRELADAMMYDLLIQRNTWRWRARSWYRALRLGGGPAADPQNRKKIHTAP